MTDAYDHPSLEDQLTRLQGVRQLVEDAWKAV